MSPRSLGSSLIVACLSGVMANCTVIHNEIGDSRVTERAEVAYKSKQSDDPASRASVPGNRTEILHLLGPPDKIGRLGAERYAFGYEYRKVIENQIGLSIPSVPFLKVAIGKAGAEHRALLIEFTEADQVVAAGLASWSEDVGFGFNIQMIFSVAPTTDTRGLRECWETESWTTDLLHGPVGLVNLAHDPDAGDSGMRLSGMPKPDKQWPDGRGDRR